MNVKNVTNFVVKNDTLNEYLREICKYKPLSREKERELFMEYKNCEDDDRRQQIKDTIILSNLRFNFAVAKRYDNGDLLPDLINVGFLGMCEAFDEYDLEKETRFYTWAQFYIRRAINAYLVKENMPVRQKNYARIAPKVKKIENDYILKTGRAPSPAEVIALLKSEYGITVKDEFDIYGTRVDRIDAFIGDDEDNTFENSTVFNEKTAVENGFEEDVDYEDLSYAMNQALKSLDDREKRIICLAYGYGCSREYKDKEIAEKLGLTSERVRQLRHGAIKKMRSAYVKAEE